MKGRLHTIGARFYECLWNTKSENSRKKTPCENALQEVMQELKLPELTVEELKLKIKTVNTKYTAELAMIIKSEKSVAGPHDIYVPKLFWFTQAHSFLFGVCIP